MALYFGWSSGKGRCPTLSIPESSLRAQKTGPSAMAEWLETHRGVVFPWQCDQFGHMNVRWYAHFFDDASFHLWAMHGVGHNAMLARGFHTVVAVTSTRFVRELKGGDMVLVKSAFTRVGNKSVTMYQRMFSADTDELHATQEAVEVFFDPQTRTSLPVPKDIRAALEPKLIRKPEE
jgi:acyl-CoA thioester hydrolase